MLTPNRNEDYLKRNRITYPSNLDWLFSPSSNSSSEPSSSIPQSASTPMDSTSSRDKGIDHGELNLAIAEDQDFASSNPRDLPPL